MKMKLLAIFAGMVLMGCGGEPELTAAQQFELKKLEMQQNHQRDLARIQANTDRELGAPQQYAAPQQQAAYHEPVQSAQQSYEGSAAYGGEPVSDVSSDSGIGGTLLAVGGGMLAGYAISELLDDGYRSYSDKSGRTVYVDKNGRQIDKRDYDAYKAKHPTKHALSSYNQKGKQAINTGATKTVEAGKAVKTKTVEAAKKVDQKVVQPTKQAVKSKTSSYKSSRSSSRRR